MRIDAKIIGITTAKIVVAIEKIIVFFYFLYIINKQQATFRKFFTIILDFLIGFKDLSAEKRSPFYDSGINHTQSIEYDELAQIFSHIKLSKNDVFVDIGCGRGRVINYLLLPQFKGEIYGIEIDPEIALFTQERLKKYRAIILCGDALQRVPLNATILFLFNPFNSAELMRRFIDLIEEEYIELKLIYYYPKFLSCFTERPRWECTERRINSHARNHYISCAFLSYKKQWNL